jgi:hypothetical protein
MEANLLAVERQVCSMEMLSDLGSMHSAVILASCDEKQWVVYILPTFHGRRTQFLDIQPEAVRYPLYTAGIADKNLKLVVLKCLVSLWPRSAKWILVSLPR